MIDHMSCADIPKIFIFDCCRAGRSFVNSYTYFAEGSRVGTATRGRSIVRQAPAHSAKTGFLTIFSTTQGNEAPDDGYLSKYLRKVVEKTIGMFDLEEMAAPN